MPRYTVTVVETVQTHYELEVEAGTEEEAGLTAEDILVNNADHHPDAVEAAIQSEKLLSLIRSAKLA